MNNRTPTSLHAVVDSADTIPVVISTDTLPAVVDFSDSNNVVVGSTPFKAVMNQLKNEVHDVLSLSKEELENVDHIEYNISFNPVLSVKIFTKNS